MEIEKIGGIYWLLMLAVDLIETLNYHCSLSGGGYTLSLYNSKKVILFADIWL